MHPEDSEYQEDLRQVALNCGSHMEGHSRTVSRGGKKAGLPGESDHTGKGF